MTPSTDTPMREGSRDGQGGCLVCGKDTPSRWSLTPSTSVAAAVNVSLASGAVNPATCFAER